MKIYLKNIRFSWAGVLVVISGIASALMYLLTPLFGDDWGYLMVHRTSTGLDGTYPLYMFWFADLRHWLYANGRMANFLASFCLGVLPQAVIDVVLGVAAAAGAWLMIRLSRLRPADGYGSAAVLMVAGYMLLFPWWDMMYTIDFAFNYPLTLAVVLGAVYMFQRRALRGYKWLLVVAGFLAGCMHESASLPLVIAFGGWIALRKKWEKLTCGQRALAAGFLAGTAVATLSPGILLRASVGEAWRVPDDTPWLLVVKSAPVTLAVLAVFLFSLLNPAVRGSMRRLVASPAAAWGVASLIALLPVAAGGIVGRSGWFSQAYALIFLGQWVVAMRVRAPRRLMATLGAVAWIAVVIQSIATVVVTVKFHREMTAIDRAWLESPDGIVFAPDINYTIGPWYTLQRITHRTQYDIYEARELARFYHRDSIPPVILPPEAATLDFDTLARAVYPGCVIEAADVEQPEVHSELTDTVSFRRSGRPFRLLLPPRRLPWGYR